MDTNLCGCDMCSQVGHNEKHLLLIIIFSVVV